MAVADFGGVTKTVCLAYVPEVGVGDYTIVHAGFAITPARRGVGRRDAADVSPSWDARERAGPGRAGAVKYLDEFQDPVLAGRLFAEIDAAVTRPWALMESAGARPTPSCATALTSCCRTPLSSSTDRAARSASPVGDDRAGPRDRVPTRRGLLLLRGHARVPGRDRDLFASRPVAATSGSCTRRSTPLPSPRRSRIARWCSSASGSRRRPGQRHGRRPGTRPGTGQLLHAGEPRPGPPAIEAILSSPTSRVNGFLAAGHVCSVMGTGQYEPLADRYHVPIVVTGFEPLDVLDGIRRCILQLEEGRGEVENAYARRCRSGGTRWPRPCWPRSSRSVTGPGGGSGSFQGAGGGSPRLRRLRRRAAVRRG